MYCAPQTAGEKKRSGHSDSNGFAGHINLPDLVQQSHSPAGTPTEGLGRVSSHSQEMDPGTEVGAGQQKRQFCFSWVLNPALFKNEVLPHTLKNVWLASTVQLLI
jgi:hypothetical protein